MSGWLKSYVILHYDIVWISSEWKWSLPANAVVASNMVWMRCQSSFHSSRFVTRRPGRSNNSYRGLVWTLWLAILLRCWASYCPLSDWCPELTGLSRCDGICSGSGFLAKMISVASLQVFKLLADLNTGRCSSRNDSRTLSAVTPLWQLWGTGSS